MYYSWQSWLIVAIDFAEFEHTPVLDSYYFAAHHYLTWFALYDFSTAARCAADVAAAEADAALTYVVVAEAAAAVAFVVDAKNFDTLVVVCRSSQ